MQPKWLSAVYKEIKSALRKRLKSGFQKESEGRPNQTNVQHSSVEVDHQSTMSIYIYMQYMYTYILYAFNQSIIACACRENHQWLQQSVF